MTKITTLCYIERDNQYLMLHRTKKQNDENHDKWIGVGGKFEDGESPEQCMLREVFEETGLHPTQWDFRGLITFVSDIWPCEYMHLFRCTQWTGTQKNCDEGDLEWIDKNHLLELNIWEGDKIILKLLDSEIPFFSLRLEYQGEKLINATLNGKQSLLDSFY